MKTKYIIIGCLAMGLASCTGDELSKEAEVVAGTSGIKTITATVADFGPMTRSELYREDDDINFRWSAGDVLGIFPDKGDQVSFTINENQAGSLTATFDGGGWALKDAYTYHVYFPHVYENRDLTAIPMDYTGQKQIGKDTYSHLGKYDFLATDAVTPTGSSLSFTMYHQGSAMILKLKVAEVGTFTSMTLTADNDVFTTKAELNIAGDTPVVTPVEQSNSVTLQLQDVTTSSANEEFTLSMMTLPVNLTAETLSVSLIRDDGSFFSGVIRNPKNIEVGKPYEMAADLTYGGIISNDLIAFADANVKAICIANWDTDGDGEISYEEAANVSDMGNLFVGQNISSFKEFQYFTGLTTSTQVEEAFLNSSLVSLVLPNTLTSTGINMFKGCHYLKNVTLPESLMTINSHTFEGCASLSSITLPESIRFIGDNAFSSCRSLSKIKLPEGIRSIGNNAFENCSKLSSITVPKGITSIGSYTFSGCSSLTDITLPEGITTIGDYAFSGCSSLTNITLPEGITSIGNYAFSVCSNLTDVTLQKGITSIGNYAFSECSNLTNITLPEGITTIGCNTFEYCSSLTDITLPEGITSLGGNFYECRNLVSITLPKSLKDIGDNTFRSCSSLTSITLPDEVTYIGMWAFDYCRNLTSIKMPENLQKIDEAAFQSCSSLTSITLHDALYYIGMDAFHGCDNLTSIQMSAHLRKIERGAFSACRSLTSITLPESVIYIGEDAFSSCDSLASITCLPTTPPELGDYIFNVTNSSIYVPSTIIYVPAASVDAYKAANIWNVYDKIIQAIPE